MLAHPKLDAQLVLQVDASDFALGGAKANGLVEEFHRPLKAAIKAYNTDRWSDALPTILLGFRTTFKDTLQATTSELVYGTTIRLPGEFFEPTPSETPPNQLVEDLREHFANIRPAPTSSHGKPKVFIHPHLHRCTHVFLRTDKVCKPLQPPYEGPFKVFLRREKTFRIAIGRREVEVSLDRLKPAYYCAADEPPPITSSNTPTGASPTDNDPTTPSDNGPDLRTPTAPSNKQHRTRDTTRRRHCARTKPGSAHDSFPPVQSTPADRNQNNSRCCRRHYPEADPQDILRKNNSPTTSISRKKKIGVHTYSKSMSDFILPNSTPFGFLDCQDAFNLLSEKEKLYSHYMARASWLGALIISLQNSMESPVIFSLLHKLFSLNGVKDLKEIALKQCQFNEEDYIAFLIYTCGIFSNFGNYKGFGDSKIIPNLSKGTTKYLSKNIEEEDNENVTSFLKQKDMEVWNSRLIKYVNESGTTCYEIRLASVLNTDDKESNNILSTDIINSCKFLVTRGDYSQLLEKVNENLKLAQTYAANENQVQMIEKYIESFHTGSIDAHKDGSRFWVKDKEPIIESYIGFIENYTDPAGVRSEFEGFVAMVNKPRSAIFSELVKLSEELISLLPWPSAYEKDKFLQPDFSSLDLLAFATKDVPIGINIPNYDDIRQCEGFKNVTLGNVIRMRQYDVPNFLSKEDQELFIKYRVDALEVQTALHELLGHGSGKLFQKKEDGTFNFDADNVLNYETNEKVSSWYEKGESFSSVFGSISSAYEECRAESIGLYLSTLPEVLKIFGLEGTVADDAMYTNWIDCIYSGIEALKSYDPNTKSWLQAHSQAAYVMLQVLLECKGNFVNVQKIAGEDGQPDLLFTMDRTKILSHGKPCIEAFIKKLQLYKAIADKKSAVKMFSNYSAVTSEDKYPFLQYREIVMARKKPRRLIVQANTFIEDGKVVLQTYEPSPEGLIQSFVERYNDPTIYSILDLLWEKDLQHF
ncbi:hypothetical protein JTE90_026341 [Oedothorax gibbosus]|uniref:Dipeptidyl peptidase 3 n=1 Tax=Oedothorax gibbosus TaxID=931172 RepID=A0AAV6U6C6_9ARAC|nr:hypothetical protein JTE90_026341 [Oedothorax gibbosus]